MGKNEQSQIYTDTFARPASHVEHICFTAAVYSSFAEAQRRRAQTKATKKLNESYYCDLLSLSCLCTNIIKNSNNNNNAYNKIEIKVITMNEWQLIDVATNTKYCITSEALHAV